MTVSIGAALDQLESTVHDRLANADSKGSYVASLSAKGLNTIAKKLGEEATETIIAALTEDDAALIGEASDLIFHLTVLLAERGVKWEAVAGELSRRHGTSGIAEKAARSSD